MRYRWRDGGEKGSGIGSFRWIDGWRRRLGEERGLRHMCVCIDRLDMYTVPPMP